MDLPLPQGLLDQLNRTLAAKQAADVGTVAKQASADFLGATRIRVAAEVAAAEADDQQKAAELAAQTATLDAERRKLEAIEDAYFVPGATLPTPPPVTPPA